MQEVGWKESGKGLPAADVLGDLVGHLVRVRCEDEEIRRSSRVTEDADGVCGASPFLDYSRSDCCVLFGVYPHTMSVSDWLGQVLK